MYKKTSVVDKIMTKCLIAAVLIVVVTAPVLSSAGVALAQQPSTANLTIENYVNVLNQCTLRAEYCPGSQSFTGMVTTITIGKNPENPEQKILFPAGPWMQTTTKVIPIPIGKDYRVAATCTAASCTYRAGDPRHGFSYEKVYISGNGLRCLNNNPAWDVRCDSIMGPNGATVLVKYNWLQIGGK